MIVHMFNKTITCMCASFGKIEGYPSLCSHPRTSLDGSSRTPCSPCAEDRPGEIINLTKIVDMLMLYLRIVEPRVDVFVDVPILGPQLGAVVGPSLA